MCFSVVNKCQYCEFFSNKYIFVMNTLRFKWNLLYVLILDHFCRLVAVYSFLKFKTANVSLCGFLHEIITKNMIAYLRISFNISRNYFGG